MATPHRLRHHVGVFRSVFAYMHEAMVAAYVRDATLAPMDDETPAPYVAPWLVVCILSSAMMLSGEPPAHPPKACSPNLALPRCSCKNGAFGAEEEGFEPSIPR